MNAKQVFGSALLALCLACGGDEAGTSGIGDAGTRADGPAATNTSCEGDVCILTGTVTKDLKLSADKKWLLRGGVFIGDDINPAVLTIEAGTTIYGETSTNGMLVVRRHAKIKAEGTREAPIVFTSSKPEGQRARGDWGGIIINGLATVNSCGDKAKGGCEAFGEGGTGYYGGDQDDDDSGVLRYVRIEFAGRLISPDNELNGLALQGVGSGTTLEYIQVHMGKDDGVEFFGGTVNFKYLITTGIADDNLDWTDGWRGKGQFFIAQQYDDAGDNGIEADNNAENNASKPRSQPTLANITLIGSRSENSDIGVLLREGTAANIRSMVVAGFNDGCIDIDHVETYNNAFKDNKPTKELTIDYTIVDCGTNFLDNDEKDDTGALKFEQPFLVQDFVMTLSEGNLAVDPQLMSAFDAEAPDFKPKKNSPAEKNGKVFADPFFDQVTFIGAVDPANDWTAGWTTNARN